MKNLNKLLNFFILMFNKKIYKIFNILQKNFFYKIFIVIIVYFIKQINKFSLNLLNKSKLKSFKLLNFLKKILFIIKNFKINSFLYKMRVKLLLIISNILIQHQHLKNNIIEFIYCGLNNNTVTATLLGNYICKLLKNRYPIYQILMPMFYDLKKKTDIIGFKIMCAGRLTKKERAKTVIQRYGAVRLSTVRIFIDYAFDFVILRHGVCGVKVWLCKKQKSILYNYKINFIY